MCSFVLGYSPEEFCRHARRHRRRAAGCGSADYRRDRYRRGRRGVRGPGVAGYSRQDTGDTVSLTSGALHPGIRAVLDFWFGELRDGFPVENHNGRWFLGHEDALLASRFGFAVEAALEGQYDEWAESPAGQLALILLLDQFHPQPVPRQRARIQRRSAGAGVLPGRPAERPSPPAGASAATVLLYAAAAQ